MNVEKASTNDINELVELRIAYLTEDSGPMDDGVTETIRTGLPNYFLEHLGRDLTVYVAREGSCIASCVFSIVVEKPLSPAFITGKTANVLNVYTRPALRRRGYAKRLMEALLDDAQDRGLSVIELKATEDGYPLYRSVGFTDDASKYHAMKWTNGDV